MSVKTVQFRPLLAMVIKSRLSLGMDAAAFASDDDDDGVNRFAGNRIYRNAPRAYDKCGTLVFRLIMVMIHYPRIFRALLIELAVFLAQL